MDAVVCHLFMPRKLITLDLSINAYYSIPSVMKRVQTCARARNPLTQYHLRICMKGDEDDENGDEDVIPEKLQAINEL